MLPCVKAHLCPDKRSVILLPSSSRADLCHVDKGRLVPTWMRSKILPYVKLTCACIGKRSVAPALARIRSVILPYVKLTCAYIGKRSVAPALAWMRSVMLLCVKLTCAYIDKRSMAPALAWMRSVMLLCVKLTCAYVDKRRVAPTLAWMRRAILPYVKLTCAYVDKKNMTYVSELWITSECLVVYLSQTRNTLKFKESWLQDESSEWNN